MARSALRVRFEAVQGGGRLSSTSHGDHPASDNFPGRWCLFPQNATSTQVPADVKQYGLGFFPPPELPGDAVFGIDRFYFP